MNKIKQLILIPLLLFCVVDARAEGIGLPQGRFVEVDQHRMHIDCTGKGQVTIVVDSGIGGASVEWLLVRQQLDSQVRFCAYDRAGYGWSDPGFSARTTENISAELQQLLNAAGEKPPYVMMGHSFGGFTARYFAHRYPNQVIGMVFIDASHPDQTQRMKKLVTGTKKRTNGVNPLQAPKNDSIANLPEPHRSQATFLNSRRKAIFAQMDEIKHFSESADQVKEATPLPDIPTLVITRGKKVWPDDTQGQLMEATWKELQSSLADLTSHGRQRIAEGSGHNIHLDQPELIGEEVSRFLQELDPQPVHISVVDIDQ